MNKIQELKSARLKVPSSDYKYTHEIEENFPCTYDLRGNLLSLDNNIAMTFDGITFALGDCVLHEDGSAGVIKSFELDLDNIEFKVNTTQQKFVGLNTITRH